MQHRVRFILKNGCDFIVHCENAKTTMVGGEITAYSLTNISLNRPLYIDIEQIAAVIDEGPIDESGAEG